MACTYNGILFSLKKVEILDTSYNLKDTMLNVISQSQEDNYCVNPPTGGTQSTGLVETENRMVVARGCKGREMGGVILQSVLSSRLGKMKSSGDRLC